jgi:long-chain acyl-CoA synthetase
VGKTILIPNPRDMPAVLKELSQHRIHSFPAVNTLFNGLANHPTSTVDWSNLKVSVGGGMAVQCRGQAVAGQDRLPHVRRLRPVGNQPVGQLQPGDATEFSGSIGVPLPSTWLKLLDDDGNEVPTRPAWRNRHQGPAGDGRLLAAPGRNRQGHDG